MKKLIGLLLLFVITTLMFAGIHSDNIRQTGQINNSVMKIERYTEAYFNGVEVDGQTIILTQEQKDALKTAANVELEKIKTYADSLTIYP